MSSAFVRTPNTSSHALLLPTRNEYHQTPYYPAGRTHTPFLLPSPVPSQVHPHSAHDLSPVLPTASQNVPFPSTDTSYTGGLAPTQDIRQRLPSWHGAPIYPSDAVQPTNPSIQGHHTRRHSFSSTSNQPLLQQASVKPYPTVGSTGSYLPTQTLINPWLNASLPRSDFFFDLITTAFSPLRLFGPGQSTMLSTKEFEEPATHPPLTRMRIICALIPQWPIDLEYQNNTTTTPFSSHPTSTYTYQHRTPPLPITVADVLITIHQAMHTSISHVDWARLSRRDEKAIRKAHLKRCKMDDLETAQGVKRVDFLLGATKFMGLVSNGVQDGWEVMTLITSDGRLGGGDIGAKTRRARY
jgi:hypothetical protein